MSRETLADLHAKARQLGIPRYRLLERKELEKAIKCASRGRRYGPEPSELAPGVVKEELTEDQLAGDEEPTPELRETEPEHGAEAEEQPLAGEPETEEPAAEEPETEGPETEGPETEEVTGVLDRMPQGYGFLRLAGLRTGHDDVYISASQIKRCELRPGDEVTGPARPPRRGERHRALVRVAAVNGQDPEGHRVKFEDLTPVPPRRRVAVADEADPLLRAVDLLAPLALGQRILILAQPRSGRTTLLRALGRAYTDAGAELIVLLVDERPEEVTRWEQALPEAEIAAAPADTEPRDQVRAAELAIGHARRRAEAGEDVAVLVDSLSRLALGYRDPSRVKRLFGAGRELEEEGAGSLTVAATVLEGDEGEAEVRTAVETTENVRLKLNAGLAAAGIFPSLVAAECRSSGEEELRTGEELERARELRSELSQMEAEDAARTLGERIAASTDNRELLA